MILARAQGTDGLSSFRFSGSGGRAQAPDNQTEKDGDEEGQTEALGEIRLPEAQKAEADAYHIHPVLLDAAVQSLSEGEAVEPPEEAPQERISLLIELLQANEFPSARIESGFASARAKNRGVLTPEYVEEQIAKQEKLREKAGASK